MSTHPGHITAHRRGFAPGVTEIVREGEQHDCLVDFAIVKLAQAARVEELHAKETAWVLLEGRMSVTVDGRTHELSRSSLFDERPSAVHVAANTHVAISAHGDVELARVRTTNAKKFAPRVFTPGDTTSEARGRGLVQGAAERAVRLVFDIETRPESMLVVGEVVHLAGRWSSYPPHHHAQPELYHYRFTKPQGYGHAELGDDVLKVKQFDTVKILDGVDHPQVAAPGYGMYYLWIVRHHEGAPYRGFTYDDDHKWVLNKDEQGWSPTELS